MDLPNELRDALDDELATIPLKQLAARVAALSAHYRASSTSQQPPATFAAQATGQPRQGARADALAYAAFRLPATYGAVRAALGAVHDRLPDWQPHTLLDVGAGPGTAMWAATDLWPDLDAVTLLERDAGMMALGRALAARSPWAAMRSATWHEADLNGSWQAAPADLIIASYVLGELPEAARESLVERLWASASADGVLLLIEPGTPVGYAHIHAAHKQPVAADAHVVAPNPTDAPCPLSADDWLHFAVRVSRSRVHRAAKGADLPYEDEKFSYVALSRQQGRPIAGRVIRHPQVGKGHIRFELCTPDGLRSVTVSRKDGALYRAARHLKWGDVWPGAE